jgi:hypothetical protein
MTDKRTRIHDEPDSSENVLTIPTDKVCYVIVMAREFDAKEEVSEPDPGSNPSDDNEISILEDQPDDPVVEELETFINSLSDDERADLVALAWLGRGDDDVSAWATLREEAVRDLAKPTGAYLLGMPLLGDYLEEGLAAFGLSC